MTRLADIIEINAQQTAAAVLFDRDVATPPLIHSFMPTKASIKVFEQLQQAVQPGSKQESRAINLFGPYGSGKSHLAVVLAQLLRDGCGAEGFEGLLARIKKFATPTLAESLKNTFLAATDKDARPYLLVSLYGSECTSIPDKLLEGLYDAVKRHPLLKQELIIPKTEYDVCVSCFTKMVNHTPALANADLPPTLSEHYLSTKELWAGLKKGQPQALAVFKQWYRLQSHGIAFNPINEGGNSFTDAYLEAGKNLAGQHHFGGIVVIWDEFGFALDDLLGNSHRNPQQEIMALQHFVEKTGRPDLGHTLFIGLTHEGLQAYAARTQNQAATDTLDKISGRFTSARIELNPSESEGYHLLGMQHHLTTQGQQLLATADAIQHQQTLLNHCRPLAVFKPLETHLEELVMDIYPLHPLLAAGLFSFSKDFAQSNRTALTFFRDHSAQFLQRELNPARLFRGELVRLPVLVDYYEESIKEKEPGEWRRYRQAVSKIPAEADSKKAILKLCWLAPLLGKQFQTTEQFLAIALYDRLESERVEADLKWLKAEHLLWKRDVTGQWTLFGDGGLDIEEAIAKELKDNIKENTPKALFDKYPAMLEDLLPMVGAQEGIHDLEPSAGGIVRCYRVDLLTPVTLTHALTGIHHPLFKIADLHFSAQVYLVLAKDLDEANAVKACIANGPIANVYFWLPMDGIQAEAVSNLLRRYVALETLLKQKTNTEDAFRQLEDKWEHNRQQLLTLLSGWFGRESLQKGTSQILQAGHATALGCQSWHAFRQVIGQAVQQTYPGEVPIRAMNMNELREEKYTTSKIVREIVERVLQLASNPTYRDDLLGHKDTSEPAALIDGVLGANGLFIQRPEGWDIKKVEETEGNIHQALKLMHDTLLRKREQPYPVKELRDKLVAAPYGIPACNLAMLAAVAVRHDIKRLRWGGDSKAKSEDNFAANLSAAFVLDSQLTIRLFDFSTKQLAMLKAVGEHFALKPQPAQADEEYATQCSYRLRDFINHQADAIKDSPHLHPKAKALVKFFKQVGNLPQDTAEFLIEQTQGELSLLKEALDDFARIEDAKRFNLQQSWQQFSAAIAPDLMERLTHERATLTAKAVGRLLQQSAAQPVDADAVTLALLNKPCQQCSDSEIGQCQGQLKMLLDYHPPQPLPLPLVVKPTDMLAPKVPAPPTDAGTTERLTHALRQHIEAASMPRKTVQEVLQRLLHDYREV